MFGNDLTSVTGIKAMIGITSGVKERLNLIVGKRRSQIRAILAVTSFNNRPLFTNKLKLRHEIQEQ